jgi:hypothetical protein
VIKNLALSSSQNSHPHEFFLEQICFPIIQEIHRDTEIPSFKVKSYYLHNKLLMMDAWIKQTNRVTENLKHDFEALIHQNEVLIAMMSKNSQSAIEQKQMYAINLKNFAKVIEDVGVKSFVLGIKMMVQIKVYNEKLRRKYGFLFLWKCEKQKFNYFRTKDWQKKSADEFFSSSKQIDAIIEQEVEYCIQDAESNRKAFGDY